MAKLEDLIERLPPELRKEVEDFAQFLLERRTVKSGGKMTQEWAGALHDYRDTYTAMDLQKKALEWRSE